MKTVWVFIKKSDGEIKELRVFGSIRQLYKECVIRINGNVKTEAGVRYLLKHGRYVDDNYLIIKEKVRKSLRGSL